MNLFLLNNKWKKIGKKVKNQNLSKKNINQS